MIYSNFSWVAFYIYSNILPWGTTQRIKGGKKACQEWMIEKHPFQERYDIIHTVKYLPRSSRYLQGNFSNIFWYIFLNGNKKWYMWIWNLYCIYFISRHFNESKTFRGIYNLLLMNIKWELSLCPIGWPRSISSFITTLQCLILWPHILLEIISPVYFQRLLSSTFSIFLTIIFMSILKISDFFYT